MSNPRRVIIALSGGLGNQLFQISHAMINFPESELIFDYGFSSASTENILSKIQLPSRIQLGISSQIPRISRKLANLELRKLSKFGLRIRRYSTTKLLEHLLCKIYEVENICVHSDAKGLNSCSTEVCFQIGYFQEFNRDHANIFELLPRNPHPNFDLWRSEATKSNPLVCHVRLGDYKSEHKIGLLAPEYFEKVIKKAWEENDCSSIWLFSDEPEEAIKVFPANLLGHVKVVPREFDSVETLLLMTLGSHFVISNSTFSWWGAFLAPFEKKSVYYPKPWFAKIPDRETLIPIGWNPVDSVFYAEGK